MHFRLTCASLGLCLGGLLLPGCRSDQNGYGYRPSVPLASVFSRREPNPASPTEPTRAPGVTPNDYYPTADEVERPTIDLSNPPPPAPPSAAPLELIPDENDENLEPTDPFPLPTSSSRRRSGLRGLIDTWRNDRSDERENSGIPLDQPVADAGETVETPSSLTARVVSYEVRPLVVLGMPEFDDEPAVHVDPDDQPAPFPPLSLTGFGHSVKTSDR
ncbi:MAG: hypothetical protein DWQ45_16085 [Planctomycetota bacterium]|nr:MAG: hypothetical protein DWQ41_01980 [Planctomycetota bacterium]REK33116.1 MAG: hypothetical protein DWQ45_16085 [Planctomycetota bacterium]